MRKIYTSFMSLLTAGMLFVGCSNQEDLGGSSEGVSSLPPYSASFKLGGSGTIIGAGGAGGASRASGELHNEAEKTVNSLYAVVFRDAAKTASLAQSTGDKEDNEADKFFTAIPLNLENPMTNLSFSLGEEGDFQVCFIGNASGHPANPEDPASGLVDKILKMTAETTTVGQFKALVEESVLTTAGAPEEYLMTSAFHPLTTKFDQVQNMGEVLLTRAMARFDIINAADGYTITEVVFHNRGVKTPVISDTPIFDEDNIEASKSYTMGEGGLVGNSSPEAEGNKYEAKIYSFEQYAENGKDFSEETAAEKQLPYLEIKYKIPSVSPDRVYSHNVYFKKAKGEKAEDGFTVNPVKRNTLYRVKMMSSPDANIGFTISVLDWDKNTEISVDDSDLVTGVVEKPLDKVEIGDFYLSDGTLRDKNKNLTEDEKKKVIGIVFQTYSKAPTRFGSAEIAELKKKGVETPHGLVMALKCANDGNFCQWKNENSTSGLPELDSKKKCYDDVSGLNNCSVVKGNDSNFAQHPAFKAASDYNTIVQAPEKSTGWFLPSMGQWWDIVSTLGNNANAQKTSEQTSDTTSNSWTWNDTDNSGGKNTSDNINVYLNKIGLPYVDLFGKGSDKYYYWSSSEYSATDGRGVAFNSPHFGMSDPDKNTTRYVRAVLAF